MIQYRSFGRLGEDWMPDTGPSRYVTSPALLQVASPSRTRPTVKEVYARDGMSCWACEIEIYVEVTTVGPADSVLFTQYQRLGLLPFSHPAHEDNLIPLCKPCRDQLNCNPPGWIFLPSKLSGFIDYEEADYEERLDAAKRGERVPPRQVPNTAGAHISFQCYVINPKFTTPIFAQKSWAGSPTAAILRASSGIMNPLGVRIPASVREEFTHLMNLYSRACPVSIQRSTARIHLPDISNRRLGPQTTLEPLHSTPLSAPTNTSGMISLPDSSSQALHDAVWAMNLPTGAPKPAECPGLRQPCQHPNCRTCYGPPLSSSSSLSSIPYTEASSEADSLAPEDSASQHGKIGKCSVSLCLVCTGKHKMIWGPGSSSKDKMMCPKQLPK